MINVARTDRTIIGAWWWTIDRVLLASVAILALLGVFVIFAASPPVAERIHDADLAFVKRHLVSMLPAAALLFASSLLAPRGVLRLGLAALVAFGVLLFLTPLIGTTTKGATRWISLGVVTLQPSEFIKPALAVTVAWLLARKPGLQGMPEASILVLGVLALLAAQPDIGMAVVVAAVFAVQLFLAGIAWLWVLGLAALAVLGLWQAYLHFPHFALRVDRFLDPDAEVYQVERALRAVESGGWWGRGPGEGVEKFRLPDAHADFVFAATAEEFGIVACFVILLLFVFVVARGFIRAHQASDRFTLLAASGLVAQVGLQAIINMAVNLDMVPTKGMTLPFLSYGGSSLVALGMGVGMLLALTRRGARLEPVR